MHRIIIIDHQYGMKLALVALPAWEPSSPQVKAFQLSLALMSAAVTVLFIWFFPLELCEKMLAPLFTKESSWRILDTLVEIIMWGIALPVLKGGFVF